jgi:hypothetical protein
MIPAHISPPPMERQPLKVGVLRTGILALIALIIGSMFTYELVRFSPSPPLPRPRPSALGAAPVFADVPSPRNTGE